MDSNVRARPVGSPGARVTATEDSAGNDPPPAARGSIQDPARCHGAVTQYILGYLPRPDQWSPWGHDTRHLALLHLSAPQGCLVNVLLAALAAVCWGAADFLGGWLTRDGDERHGESVLVTSQAVSVLAVATLLTVPSLWQATTGDLIIGALSGLGLAFGVRFLYAALATARMAIVAPVSAGTSLAVAILGGLAHDTAVTFTQLAGIAAIAAAVLTVSITRDEGGAARRPLLLALLAGAGFGSHLVALSFTHSDIAPVLLAGELSALAVFALAAIRLRAGLPTSHRGLTALCGALRAGGTGLFIAAVAAASTAATMTAANLYPIVTALAAFVILRERLTGIQRAAVALALGGLTLLVV